MRLFQPKKALPPAPRRRPLRSVVVVILILLIVFLPFLHQKLVSKSSSRPVGVLVREKAALEEELVGRHHRVVGDGEFEIGGGRDGGRGSCGALLLVFERLLDVDEVTREGDSRAAGRSTAVEGLVVGVVHV